MRTGLLLASLMISVGTPLSSSVGQSTHSPNALPAAPNPKSCDESYSRSSTEDFNKRCVALAGPLAAMRGETLVLRMDDGSRKIFDNKNGSGAAEGGFGYGLADFHLTTHIFVVCDYGADSGHCKAIYGKTGRELDFGYAFPHFSPDGNWALTVEYGEDGVTAASFAVLNARAKKSRTVWASTNSKTRLPAASSFVAWLDEKTIKFNSPSNKPTLLTQTFGETWALSKPSE